jgi:hypothetical protein
MTVLRKNKAVHTTAICRSRRWMDDLPPESMFRFDQLPILPAGGEGRCQVGEPGPKRPLCPEQWKRAPESSSGEWSSSDGPCSCALETLFQITVASATIAARSHCSDPSSNATFLHRSKLRQENSFFAKCNPLLQHQGVTKLIRFQVSKRRFSLRDK